ncbi:hypothetical protein METH_16050 [Leisingera methylohalidivorans DSM 14336]|uniref:Uncharacterized protein n=1 Tax=Leisingera methylohalidivorans DSM 14336 TaxID=999552 RepID=V9W1Y5_9RHOB|nr:hypothetical protein METH_16050 [Leisingera methylohalidivorans DSM 14336]
MNRIGKARRLAPSDVKAMQQQRQALEKPGFHRTRP